MLLKPLQMIQDLSNNWRANKKGALFDLELGTTSEFDMGNTGVGHKSTFSSHQHYKKRAKKISNEDQRKIEEN